MNVLVLKSFSEVRRAARIAAVYALLCLVVLAAGYFLRALDFSIDPFLWSATQVISSFLSFTIAANVLVRFRGTRDRGALLLGLGFIILGLIQLGGVAEIYHHLADGPAQLRVPLTWMVAQTLLACLVLSAYAVEKRLPRPRDPNRDVLATLAIVAVAGYLITVGFLAFPHEPPIHPHSRFLPRPWDLLPAGLYILATVRLRRGRERFRSAFDYALIWTAVMNAACQLLASQSVRLLDAPASAAQLLHVSSFAVLLGATLVDNSRLFSRSQDLATSDSLTGLANYRRLVDVLQAEIERSGRTHRTFAILLMDLDKLKTINDRYGHLEGSKALCRIAEVLRLHCRSIDVAARYGGDEFALVLPETDKAAAFRVAARIRARLKEDPTEPRLSVSIGVAAFPKSGVTVEQLLDAADKALYEMKARTKPEGTPSRETSKPANKAN
ncbi:MAG: GGDEF domain-containing protein [Candidatus Acidiferrales bacterium]